MIVLVMGVAGVGKTTIGEALARALGARFIDADDYHPPENVAKMKAGIPLQDADRWPWLASSERRIEEAAERGAGLLSAEGKLPAAAGRGHHGLQGGLPARAAPS